MFAELDPNVTAIAAQPIKLRPELDGKAFSHIPDFALVVSERGEIHEVKSARAYGHTDVKRRLRAAARSVESCGWDYFVAVQSDLLSDPRYEQICDVWRRFHPTYTRIQMLAAQSALAKAEMPIADLMKALDRSVGCSAPTFEQILSLAANGSIFIDFLAPISQASLVRFPDREALPARLLPARRPVDDLPWEIADELH